MTNLCKRIITITLAIMVILCSGNVFAQVVPKAVMLSSYVYVNGQLDKSDVGKEVTMMLLKLSADEENILPTDIGYISQTQVLADGSYSFKFKCVLNISLYKLKVNQAGDNITSSVLNATATSQVVSATLDLQQVATKAVISANIENIFGLKTALYQIGIEFYTEAGTLINTELSIEKLLETQNIQETTTYDIPSGTKTMKAILNCKDIDASVTPLNLSVTKTVEILIDMELASGSSSVSAIVNINGMGLGSQSYVLALACYSNTGKLLGVKSSNVKYVPTDISTDTLKQDVLPEGTVKVKAFMWDSISTTIPLCKVKERIANQQITCWGDSLTAGSGGNGTTYPAVLQQLSGITVNNLGIGGEHARTIAARQGGLQMVVSPFTIPAGTTTVPVSIICSDGGAIKPLVARDYGINPCFINGIEGRLTQIGFTNGPEIGQYYFTRTTAGDAVSVSEDTTVITDGMINRRKDITVIFIGQNGGYDNDINKLISIQRSMINYLDYENKQYVVLGLTTLNASSRKELEDAMLKEYGGNFINLRAYLTSEQVLFDAFSVAETDTIADVREIMRQKLIAEDAVNGETKYNKVITDMAVGLVPSVFLSDNVHFNPLGYQLIGKYVYDKMVDLRIIDK